MERTSDSGVNPAAAPAARSTTTRDAGAAARAGGGAPARFTLGDWLVNVPTRRLRLGEVEVTLEPRPMAVLVELCRRPGEVIAAEDLLQRCWPEAVVGDNPIHKVVAGLRRALGDSATEPRYIETIRKQGYRLVAPIGVLSAQGTRSHEGGWRGQSPFRGLEPFQAEHAAVFFGRDDAVAALQSRLTAQWRRRQPLVVLLGPSGSGKTSLVQAGLLPALCAKADPSDDAAPRTGRRPTTATPADQPLSVCTAATVDLAALGDLDPWSALAGAMLDWELGDAPLLSGHSIDTLAGELRHRLDEVLRLLEIVLDALAAGTGRGAQAAPPGPPLLVLDRLEALFQPAAEAHVEAFVACVDRLVRSGRVLVLAVCRNDFYPGLARHPAFMRDKEHGAHLDLAPPDAEAIAQMIRLPARAAGLVFGADANGLNRLDDRLCADAIHAPDALPLLQYTLQELYLNRGAGDALTWEAYEALGGLEGAIGRRAEAVLAGLPAPQQEALGRLLPRLVTMAGEDASPTSRWVAASELSGDDERALARAFVDARLLVADRVGEAIGLRVAHEALLRRWPRVTAWVGQHRATLASRDELRPWLTRWQEGEQSPLLLLPRGAMLWQAARMLAEAPSLFTEDERGFIDRSLARARRQRVWRWGAVVASLMLGVLAVIAAFAYSRQAQVAAERERQSQRLASFMLGDLADKLRPIGKLELLSRIGEQGVKLLAPIDGSSESPLDALQRAKALVVIGEVNSSRGQGRTDIATDALKAAQRLLEPLAQAAEQDPAEYYRTSGAAAFWLGQMAFDAGDLERATQEMLRYQDACERWRAALPEDATAQVELAFAVNSLGSIAFRRGAWAEAQRWFEQALALKLTFLNQDPGSEEALDGVVNSRNWLGQVAHVRGEPLQALKVFEAAEAMAAALTARHPEEFARIRDLGTVQLRRADALRALGQREEAARVMAGGVAMLRQAESHDARNQYWRADRLHAESNLLLAQADAGWPIEASLKSLRAQVPLAVDADAGREFLRRESMARISVAEVELAVRAGHWSQAAERADVALREISALVLLRPLHWQSRELQARLSLLRIRTELAAGNAQPSLAALCARLRNEIQPAVDAGQGGLVLEAWLIAQRCSGSPGVDPDWKARLTAGGYVPAHAALLSP
ncbi:nSTAND1 domain-containing NTPase [Roseateles amylovorans]|uniref:Winged helix-turn-helix domain-containing protein n=1 Tax=Roseateles amylovorans TaxID=2978473 RepID=A0ABY6NLX3_9BURK|nr:winged helix-turn-helix domain-containing protein [Roseateles amylovorans]UZH44152.1 winged helix-turn-helix domain-containing protein [Roseateles amylovorans]